MKEMQKKKACPVGRDDDGAGCIGAIIGVVITVAIAVLVITLLVTITVFAGVFVGGVYSLINYFASLKENLIDSNRKTIRI